MTARKTARRKAAASKSTVYDGSRLIGEIRPGARGFTARLAGGRRLGAFVSAQLAMRAITSAARAERSATTRLSEQT